MDSDFYISIGLVKSLLHDYGISKDDIQEEGYLISALCWKITGETGLGIVQDELDKINLQLFLSSCTKGNVEITGNINKPHNGEVKNQPKKISIQANVLHRLLDFQFTEDPNITTIKKSLERTTNALHQANNNRMIGKELDYICGIMREDELFHNWNQRKTYSFLYDLCSLNKLVEEDKGHTFKGDIAKNKEDWVKSRINSYRDWWLKYLIPSIIPNNEKNQGGKG